MRHAISSALALALSAAAATAADKPAASEACPRPENVMAVLQRIYPGIEMNRIRGDEARRFAFAFSDGTPGSRWPADEVVIARNIKADRARISFFKEGCLLAIVSRTLWSVDSLQRSLKTAQEI